MSPSPQRELELENERLRRALDNITDGTIVLDRRWRYTLVSGRAAQILGRPPEALLSRCVWDLFPHALTTRFHEGFQRAMQTQQPVHFEEYYPAPLDQWLECHCLPSPAELTVYFRDVSARKRGEDALRENTALLQAIAETSPDAIFAKDRDGRMRFANPATLALIGKSAAEVIGRTDAELLEDRQVALEVMRTDRRVMAGGVSVELEETVPTPEGAQRLWLSRKTPYRDDTGAVVGLLGISRDITARKRAEEALKEAGRRKDEFIAVLAHELRNPLAPVRNAVEVLHRLGPAEPRLQRAREIIERQVLHMTRLIDDLLDVSRIARGKLALQQERCDLAAIARETAEDYRAHLEAAGLELVAPASPPAWVDGDPVRLAQVIGNLLNNAGRFTERGGRVEVRTQADPAFVRVTVEDSGVGIAPALLPRLFDPFSQAEQDLARTRGGLGLGLAAARGLAELHGGQVEAHSEGEGRGSRFTLRVPAREAPARGPSRPAAEEPPGKGVRILVVEDNEDAAQSLGELLELFGHEVQLAPGGAAALETAAWFQPRIVISDLGLPDMDGYAVARALRREDGTRDAFLIALSGYASDEARRRSLEAGFDAHLAKPPDLPRLEQLLASAVRV